MIVLVHLSGEWDSKINFLDYFMEGMVITTKNDFNGFIQKILTHINVDTSIFLEFHNKIDDDSTPMLIPNIMGMWVHMELKKGSGKFKNDPLCITWKVIDIHYHFQWLKKMMGLSIPN